VPIRSTKGKVEHMVPGTEDPVRECRIVVFHAWGNRPRAAKIMAVSAVAGTHPAAYRQYVE
jgi:hypothetical protein